MKSLKLICVSIAFLVSIAVGAYVAMAGTVLPLPGVTGPSLGDPVTNLFSIMQALQNNTFANFNSYSSGAVATGTTQAACTQLVPGYSFLTNALGSTGTACLPTAKSGAQVVIANNTGQTVDIFGATSTLAFNASQDFINGTIGSSAYTGLTNGKTSICTAPQAGSWWCISGN